MITFRKASLGDSEALWTIIQPIIEKGDTYVFDPVTPKETLLEYWLGMDKTTYVALENELVVGTFLIKDNQPGLGSHVCNAGYMVHQNQGGKGIGRAMGVYSLIEAKKMGYKAMQFNFVVNTNENAVKLWKSLGFKIIGQSPKAFNRLTLGYVDTYIMHKFL